MLRCLSVGLVIEFLLFAASAVAGDLVLQTVPESGVLGVSAPVVWQIEWNGGDAPRDVRYTLERGGRTEIAHGTLELVDGRAELKASLDLPGTLLAHFAAKTSDGKEHKATGGAIVARNPAANGAIAQISILK